MVMFRPLLITISLSTFSKKVGRVYRNPVKVAVILETDELDSVNLSNDSSWKGLCGLLYSITPKREIYLYFSN